MNITLRDLLDAGVHFGHQLRRFNPKSRRFVFDNRHGISIIDLEKTYACLERAADFMTDLTADQKDILFVGTKPQAQEIIREAAAQCQVPFAANRWMGGTLTNFATIKNSITKYKRFRAMEVDGSLDDLPKKEGAAIRREMNRMNRNFEGLLEMPDLPSALFVIDIKHEQIAVAEANRLEIPVIGLIDTNSDPNLVQYPIPGNDDSTKSIRIVVETLLDAVQEGIARRDVLQSNLMLKPLVRTSDVKEEQLPVTSYMPLASESMSPGKPEVLESYSTDEDSK